MSNFYLIAGQQQQDNYKTYTHTHTHTQLHTYLTGYSYLFIFIDWPEYDRYYIIEISPNSSNAEHDQYVDGWPLAIQGVSLYLRIV